MTLLASTISYVVKSKIFYQKTAQRGFVGLDWQKYLLNMAMHELKPVRLLCLSAYKQYEERSRYFVRAADTWAAH